MNLKEEQKLSTVALVEKEKEEDDDEHLDSSDEVIAPVNNEETENFVAED